MDLKITYKKIKYIHLRVKEGQVCVSAPFFTSRDTIHHFVNQNLSFIQNQIDKQKQRNEKKTLKLKDTITIFGKNYTILPTSFASKITEHYLFLNEKQDYRKQIKILFQPILYKRMYSLTLKYYQRMALQCPFPKIIIKDVKSKWGSYCKNKHEILYASELIFKDEIVYDYLVVHELSHILQFNHSLAFYQIVEQYCPNYKALRKKLKEG